MQPLQEQLAALIRTYDPRETVFELELAENDGQPIVRGVVLTPTQREELSHHFPTAIVDVVVLQEQALGEAVVIRAVADVRAAPGRDEELITEALFGTRVELLQALGTWWRVRLPDGYLGWVSTHCLVQDAEALRRYRDDLSHVVRTRLESVLGLDGRQVTLLPWGVALPIDEFREGIAYFITPDGIPGMIDADALKPIEDQPTLDAAGCEEALERVMRFVGVPYLWGGVSTYGFDCSGLAQTLYRWMGHALPRDADQQSKCGRDITRDAIQAGDLLFWASNGAEGRAQRISHVSIALDSETTIHANQHNWSISIDPIATVQGWFDERTDPGLIAVRRLVAE